VEAGEEKEGEARVIYGNGRILVVDDEPLVRNLAADALKTFGYETCTAVDGREAVEYFEEHYKEIDLVLMDVMMPRMNAKEAFYVMKEIDPAVRVLLFSGHQGQVEVERLIEDGALGFLKKPVSVADLSMAVERALTSGAPSGAPAES
ncbi:MAG: response regulator, partial [Planctomycetota bacterium]|jgi:DNA-binding NtrC family response regulator